MHYSTLLVSSLILSQSVVKLTPALFNTISLKLDAESVSNKLTHALFNTISLKLDAESVSNKINSCIIQHY